MVPEIVRGVIVSVISLIIIMIIIYYFSEQKQERLIEPSGKINDERRLNIESIRRISLRNFTSKLLDKAPLRKIINTHLKTAYGSNLNLENYSLLSNFEGQLNELQSDVSQNKKFIKLLEDNLIQEELEFDSSLKDKYTQLLTLYDSKLDDTYLNRYLATHLEEVKANVEQYKTAPVIDLT